MAVETTTMKAKYASGPKTSMITSVAVISVRSSSKIMVAMPTTTI